MFTYGQVAIDFVNNDTDLFSDEQLENALITGIDSNGYITSIFITYYQVAIMHCLWYDTILVYPHRIYS